MRRFPWYLVIGLVIGIISGVVYSLVIAPIRYTSTAPKSLSAAYKDDYRSLIALAYLADGDLGRATTRLSLLKDQTIIEALAAQSQRVYAEGGASDEAQALSLLAVALFQKTSATEIVAAETPNPSSGNPSGTMSSTLTSLVTFTPHPAPTLTPTPGAPFVLANRQQICDAKLLPALMQVQVVDATGISLAGVSLTVTWSGGQDHFVTGLFPDYGPGYAEFDMTPDIIYTLQAGEDGEQVGNLQAPQCTNADGSTYWGGWQITYKQP